MGYMKFTIPQFTPGKYPTISTAIFVLTIVVAHVFATHGYEWTKNTIIIPETNITNPYPTASPM